VTGWVSQIATVFKSASFVIHLLPRRRRHSGLLGGLGANTTVTL